MAVNIIAEKLHLQKSKEQPASSLAPTLVKLTIQKNYAPHWGLREGVR
jgi:hypothetical protein